ncbi:MAG: DUF3108 domain-containing protein [Arenicellales bacterium]
MKSKLRLLLTIVLAAGASAAASPDLAQLPKSAKLVYDVSVYGAEVGNLITEISRTGDIYHVESETRAEGLAAILLGGSLHEDCDFSVSDSMEIKPRRYRIEKEGRDAYSHTADFLWDKMKVKYEDGSVLSIPRAGYVIDNCTVPFAFAAADRIALKGYPSIHILGGERMRDYDDIKVSRETVRVPAGKFDTVRIDQQRVDSPDKTLTIWVAPTMQNIAVKIVERRRSRIATRVTTMALASSKGM